MSVTDLRSKIVAAIGAGKEIRVNGSLPIQDARKSRCGSFLVLYDSEWHTHGVWPASPLWTALEAYCG